MTREEFAELQKCYYASLDLIIHGRPTDTNGDSGDLWRRAVHITLKQFADFIQLHDPRQTSTETPANDHHRGAN